MSNQAHCQLNERPPEEEWRLVSQFQQTGEPKPLILWDGACGLCFESVLWLKKRDEDQFIASPFQAVPEPPMTPALARACEDAVHILQPNGETLRAGKAVLFALGRIGYSKSARILRTPPFIWLVEIGYRLVAQNRHRLTRWIRPILRRTN